MWLLRARLDLTDNLECVRRSDRRRFQLVTFRIITNSKRSQWFDVCVLFAFALTFARGKEGQRRLR